MSINTDMARLKWGLATLHQKMVISRSVLALMTPPTPSTASLSSRAVGQRLVPLKSKCSRKWEAPAISSVSYLEPAPINMATDTALVWGMEEVNTFSPLSNVVL